ncbi:hypothetical protein HEP73_02219 [Xanthomonas sp. GW]|uniref:hypothetical protein n=1 Tax=Xanthomonas sp. GW TaxID=2724121 RepID=UPI00163A9F8F|nr:hypothetical protein [Xanthomonas sp. GW]QNH21301.1 hypothetical protein HEP73_02219 [Xanthomonas sp. GW]
MSLLVIPDSYAAWRHCVEVECGLSLHQAYIEQRIAALNDHNDHHTQQFVRCWGEPLRQQVLQWFAQAHAERADGRA